jgi:DNA repair protein RadC
MPITDWPAAERPREKLLARGADTLSDAELLALFIRTGLKGRTALDLARDWLGVFGSLRHFLDASPRELTALPRTGPGPSWPNCRRHLSWAVVIWPPRWNGRT